MTRRGARPRLLVDATALAAPRLTGVGHVLLDTLRALEEDDLAERVEVVLFAPAGEAAAVRRHGLRRARVRPVPLPRRLFGLLARTAVPIDPLVGRGVYFFPNYRNWARHASPAITFLHDGCFAVLPHLVPPERRAFLAANVPTWIARSDLVATGTPSAAHEIGTAFAVAPERMRVLPTTVDAGSFRPRPASEIEAVRRAHGLGRYLLFVGAVEPRKNVAALVRAYAAARRPAGHTLLLVGAASWDDADVEVATAAARAAGADVRRAERAVTDDEMPALMSGADALALPSWHEGFGLPVLEALACGTPVIASDVPGIRDAAAGEESSVRFVPAGDEAALAIALTEAMAIPTRVPPARVAPWRDTARLLVDLVEELAARS